MGKRVANESHLISGVSVGAAGNVLMGVRLLSRVATEICNGKLRPYGVSAVQYSLLEVIDRTEPTTRAALARVEQLDKSTLTRDLKSILIEGWVHEVREGANGRSRPLALTKSGEQVLHDAKSAWLAAQLELRSVLGQEGFSALSATVERIARMSKRTPTGR